VVTAYSMRALLSLFEGRFAATVNTMRRALEPLQSETVGSVALERVYADLEAQDFSRDVLARHEQLLQVLRVPRCGWTDSGTPKRVEEAICSLGSERLGSGATPSPAARFLDLASTQRQMRLPQVCQRRVMYCESLAGETGRPNRSVDSIEPVLGRVSHFRSSKSH
jgi:hypothetical protein